MKRAAIRSKARATDGGIPPLAAGARHRVVVLGGGFGGLRLAQNLSRAPVDITVVDRRNFHLFQPLLYQVATGGLSPGDISSPIRWALRKQRNARVILAEAAGLDAAARCVALRDGEELAYDTLVVATGARHHYFGNEEWAHRAPGLKSVEDATEMRRRILLAFERAERESDAAARRALLNFVIVGAGPTGVELAGAICELARDTLRRDFRSIDPRETRVLLVEGAERVLPQYPAGLSQNAARSLERLGVEIRVKTFVKAMDAQGVTLEYQGEQARVPTRCVLWAAGVRASRMARVLEKEAGAALDRTGRVIVEPDCSLPGHPEIFAIGDVANFGHQGTAPLPGVAPVAMQQGRFVARAITKALTGRSVAPFRYRDKGNMATIGRSAAVADFGRVCFGGFPAWLLWSAVHIFFLISHENRVLVATRWLWNYVTRNRGTRLITGDAYHE